MVMSDEIWKAVAGFEGYYEVSDCGNVRSLDRTIVASDGVKYRKKGKMLHPAPKAPAYKYLYVNLKKGTLKRVGVHRLVAIAFVDGYEEGLHVDHLNGNTFDNRASNLEWVTQTENNKRALENGQFNRAKMRASLRTDESRKHMSEVKSKPVMRDDGKLYKSCTLAAKDAGVDVSTLSDGIRKKRLVKGSRYRYLTQQERKEYRI